MKYLHIFWILLIVIASCKKSENDTIIHPKSSKDTTSQALDTIKPLSYFPVYPGSNWQYVIYKNYENNFAYTSVTDTSIVGENSSPNYRQHSYKTLLGTDSTGSRYIYGYTDTVLVPFFEGEAIYGYHKIDLTQQGSHYTKYPFMSEELGARFIPKYWDSRWPYLGPYLEVVDKKVDADNDSIIIVKADYVGNYRNYTNDYYTYKKNIGLVSHIITSELHSDTLYRKELISFNINK